MTIDELEQVWQAWAEAASNITVEDWATATRLPGWTVADVYAHHSVFPAALVGMAGNAGVNAPLTHPDAAALLAMLNAPGGPAHMMSDAVRDNAIARARKHHPAEFVDEFRITGPRAIELVRSVDTGLRVHYGGLAVLTLAEALRIALLEATVHYLDIARAMALPVPGPVAGLPLRATAALLAEIPDPLGFVECATGRSTLGVLPVMR